MHQVHNHNELTAQIHEWKRQGETIAFVPTMGNLHQGHLSLVDKARDQADKLVSSIFVNPLQFGPNEDLNNYPRTLEQDCKALMEHGCDLVYLPEMTDLYPQDLDQMTYVTVPDITTYFEGQFRQGHLSGVSTIVLKLFNLVQPDIAVFGKKDYQQWRMIEKMVSDLNLPIAILAGETIRETDGLAMSSRNQYLTRDERLTAGLIYQQLNAMTESIQVGRESFEEICSNSINRLRLAGFQVDYLEICNRHSLNPQHTNTPLVILIAAKLGKTRLIDNIEV